MRFHTDTMRIDAAYRDALRACGLDSVESVLQRVEGSIAAWSRTTDTLFVDGPPGSPGFFVKRYHYPRWRNRLRGALRGTFFGQCRGLAEFRLLRQLRELGLPAVRPVAHGARRIGHFVAACFLITEQTPHAANLTTYAEDVRAGVVQLAPARRRALIAELARQIAEMHMANFEHGQLFWRNILVRTEPVGDPEYVFLDVRPRRGRRRLGARSDWWIEEIAQIGASALPFTSRADRMRFLVEYLGARQLPSPIKDAIRRMDGLAQRWRRHEDQRIARAAQFENWRRRLARETAGVGVDD